MCVCTCILRCHRPTTAIKTYIYKKNHPSVNSNSLSEISTLNKPQYKPRISVVAASDNKLDIWSITRNMKVRFCISLLSLACHIYLPSSYSFYNSCYRCCRREILLRENFDTRGALDMASRAIGNKLVQHIFSLRAWWERSEVTVHKQSYRPTWRISYRHRWEWMTLIDGK